MRDAGGIPADELAQHPEVAVVDSMAALQTTVTHTMTIILDKNAVDLVEPAWLQATPQRWYPIVVVGYHAPVYAFREALDLGIEGPAIDWNTTPYQGGFSVWKVRTTKGNSQTACMQGYDQPATVSNIMQAVEVCDT